MDIQLIRSATLRLSYQQRQILIDPCLAAKDAYPPLVGKARNPMVDLPLSVEQILAGVEMSIVSHLHMDHFDLVAYEALPKDMLIYCQPDNQEFIVGKGFQQVVPIEERTEWQGIEMIRTPAQHGTGIWAEKMGTVSGFILRAEGEPTVYWVGDSIWYAPVAEIIAQYRPNVIITHSCGAGFEKDSPIVMDAEQTLKVCQAAPDATVIAVHMEAYDHSTVSRDDLRRYAETAGIRAEQLRIPADGETLSL